MRGAKISPELSNRIANTGVLCMLVVIINHCLAPAGETGMLGWWIFRLMGAGYYVLMFFFAVSGFFLAGHLEDPAWYRKALWKRVLSLLVPFVFWCGLYQAVQMACECVYWGVPVKEHIATVVGKPLLWKLRAVGLSPLHHPLMGPLWYLRTLFVLVAYSPLVVMALRRVPRLTLLTGLILLVLPVSDRNGEWGYFLFTFLGLRFLLPFAAGIAWRMGLLDLELPSGRAWALLVVGYIASNLTAVPTAFGLTVPPVAMSSLLSAERLGCLVFAWALANVCSSRPWPKAIVSATFPVFLVHYSVLEVFSCCLYGSAKTLPLWFAKVVFAVVASWTLAILLHKVFPRGSGILFGGR